MESSYLDKMLGPEKAARLLAKYSLDLAGKVELLTVFIEDGEMKEIRKIAHQLKGSGKSYGFDNITELGNKLSACAKGEDYPGLKDLVENLESYIKGRKKEPA